MSGGVFVFLPKLYSRGREPPQLCHHEDMEAPPPSHVVAAAAAAA